MIVIDSEADTVTMGRAEYQALIEDAEDLAHLAAREERERILGFDAVRRDHLTAELVKRLLEGEHPGATLARAARPDAERARQRRLTRKLAGALSLSVDDLVS